MTLIKLGSNGFYKLIITTFICVQELVHSAYARRRISLFAYVSTFALFVKEPAVASVLKLTVSKLNGSNSKAPKKQAS